MQHALECHWVRPFCTVIGAGILRVLDSSLHRETGSPHRAREGDGHLYGQQDCDLQCVRAASSSLLMLRSDPDPLNEHKTKQNSLFTTVQLLCTECMHKETSDTLKSWK